MYPYNFDELYVLMTSSWHEKIQKLKLVIFHLIFCCAWVWIFFCSKEYFLGVFDIPRVRDSFSVHYTENFPIFISIPISISLFPVKITRIFSFSSNILLRTLWEYQDPSLHILKHLVFFLFPVSKAHECDCLD